MTTRVLLMVGLTAASSVALMGQGAPAPIYKVPAAREPHHVVKLENRYVRVLDVTVPPYDSTLYHIHENPYVYVSIGPATLKAQVEGSSEIADLVLKDGEVRYSPIVTHRVGNIGAAPFRNITIQIQNRDDTVAAPGTPIVPEAHAAGPKTEVAFENDLIRVDRLAIAPGRASYPHSHPKSHLLVAVHSAKVKIEAAGPPVTHDMEPGDFEWHTGAYTHTITNVGTTPFDAIEVIWK